LGIERAFILLVGEWSGSGFKGSPLLLFIKKDFFIFIDFFLLPSQTVIRLLYEKREI